MRSYADKFRHNHTVCACVCVCMSHADFTAADKYMTPVCDTCVCVCVSHADFTAADKYLNLPSTRKALGVPDKLRWQSCNFEVYGNFAGDWLHRYDTVLPDMLAEGIKVMIYAGKCVRVCEVAAHKSVRWVAFVCASV